MRNRRKAVKSLGFATAALAIGGCSLFVDLGDLTSGGAITTDEAGTDALAPTDGDDGGSDMLEGYNPGDGGFVYASSDADAVPTGKWVHVDFTLDAPNTKATVAIDGTVVGTRDLVGGGWSSVKEGTVYFGAPSTGNTSLYYDNLTFY